MSDLPKNKLAVVEPEVIERAKNLYFQYRSLNQIAQDLGVSTAQLSRWRRDGEWLAERENAERGLIEDGFSQRKLTIARIMNATTDQIERALTHITKRTEPPTLAEAEKLSFILSNLDKVARLDAGKATENVNIQAKLEMSAEKIREIIQSDPARAFEQPVVEAVWEEAPVKVK
jgi:hypothetical protein